MNLVLKMPSIQKVDADIETVNKSLKENNERFEYLLKRQTFLHNYKLALEQDLIERKKVYNSILVWREKERIIQKERGFPLPEPIYGEKNTSYTWDPWLCIYISNNSDVDFELSVPSKLNLDYDNGHHHVTPEQMLKEFLRKL